MADALHQIQIDAAPERVFAAITNSAWVSGWWTDDSVTEPRLDSNAVFGYGKRRDRVADARCQVKPNTLVVWECLGEVDKWNGTWLTWNLAAQEGKTDVRFTHGSWRSTDGWFAFCNTPWGELMYRLKNHVEGKAPGPLFRSTV